MNKNKAKVWIAHRLPEEDSQSLSLHSEYSEDHVYEEDCSLTLENKDYMQNPEEYLDSDDDVYQNDTDTILEAKEYGRLACQEIDSRSTDKSEQSDSYGMKPYTIAQILMEKYRFTIIDKGLHMFMQNKGYWQYLTETDAKISFRRILPEECKANVNSNSITEIFRWLYAMADEIPDKKIRIRKDYLNLKDDAINWKTGEKIGDRSKLYFQNVLNASTKDLKKNLSKESNFMKYLRSTFGDDKETERNFLEFLGLCLSPIRDKKCSFFFVGPSNTGKTVALNLLENLIGSDFTSSLSFSQLGEEFAVAQLVGKWLNVSGEMSGIANKRIDIFKSLTGNDTITACFKGKDHFQFKNNALLVFACNNFPKIKPELVEAFSERIIIFPFDNIVPRDQWTENLNDLLYKDRGEILQYAISGLRALEERQYRFLESDVMKQRKMAFLKEANSFMAFMEEHLREDKSSSLASRQIAEYYAKYCMHNSLQCLATNVWSVILQQRFSVKKGNVTGKELPAGVQYNDRGYHGIRFVNLERIEVDI